jgi:nitrogen fixation/metabolism regulation signal transduction histidine kinase
MRIFGRTEQRVILAILVTAVIPLVASIFIARTVIARISAIAFQPEFGAHLDRSLDVYADLVKAIKQGMRYEADAIAASPVLAAGVAQTKDGDIDRALALEIVAHPSLVSLAVETEDGRTLGTRHRERRVDPQTERTLTVRRPLHPPDGVFLVAVFATPNNRFIEMESAQAFAQAYHQIERHRREEYVDKTYVNVFAVLLGLTIVLAIGAGMLVVRPVTRRIKQLAAATRPVAAGDLSVRVRIGGEDEVADLGQAFDRMLEELERSRARIEFLKRISEWQKMARRLAHEIKNPLTPIQLAVEECHRRYTGSDPAYQRILQTTLEVVEEEVGSLRRLVSEFAGFARLPRAELSEGDLGEFLREQEARFATAEIARRDDAPEDDRALFTELDLRFDIPAGEMPIVLDREMLHRVLVNIVRNAAQALRDARAGKEAPWGKVRLSTRRDGSYYVIDIEDDGPGISPEVRGAIFDPYVTTKRDGTGLGLSIVKKIVMDHGGTIDAQESPLGGARFEIRLPRAGTQEARAALERAAEAGSGQESGE